MLIAQPKYKTIQDLKGQIIGAQNPGGMINIMLAEILKKNGLNPDEVTVINMGGTQERYISLLHLSKSSATRSISSSIACLGS